MQNFPYLIENLVEGVRGNDTNNTNDISSLADIVSCLSSQQGAIQDALASVGAVLLRGFPISTAKAFDEVTASLNYESFIYQESLSNAVRVNLTQRVFTANEAPRDVEIFLHHEMAQTPLAPSVLFFYCHTAASNGGETPLCRSDLLYAQLAAEKPIWAREFEDKGLKYSSTMPRDDNRESGQGRSWKSTLSVNNKAGAEQRLSSLNYKWLWLADGSLRTTTPVLPAVKTMPDGRKTFFNQLIAAYLGWAGVKDDPSSALTFGDDTRIDPAALNYVSEIAPRFTIDLDWQAGDVAIVNNHLVMHGRRPYSGDAKRLVLVSMAA